MWRCALLFSILTLVGCGVNKQPVPVTMVVGSWYGFYPFYYAREKGLDLDNGIRLKILEPTNIGNLRRSYMRSQVDIVATSMLEFTNATRLSGLPLQPVLITDYSNGGDVVIATKAINSVEDLHGKRIAVPSQGIGEYFLSLVFNSQQPTQYFTQIKRPETECGDAFAAKEIDACITYPPISTYLLAEHDVHELHSSAQHPTRIFDVVWSKPDVPKDIQKQIQALWFKVVEMIKDNPAAYHQFVSEIASVPLEEVERSMQGIALIDEQQHIDLLNKTDSLGTDLTTACKVANGSDCEKFKTVLAGLRK